MLRLTWSFVVLTIIGLARPLPVYAVQDINGIFAETTPLQPGGTTAITVTGNTICHQLSVNFGDGSTETIPSVALPVTTSPHTYLKPGIYTLQASGEGCDGSATATLPVITLAGEPPPIRFLYCDDLGCEPTISATSFGNSAVNPGYMLAVMGTGFGFLQGQAFLHLETIFGTAVDIPLQITTWDDTLVAFMIPDDISGVLDQTSTIRVVTAGQSTSNSWPQRFIAARDIRTVAWTDLPCTQSVGPDSNNYCNDPSGHGTSGYPSECLKFPLQVGNENGDSMNGSHTTGWSLGDGGNSGFDTFSLNLNGGWLVYSRDPVTYVSDSTANDEGAFVVQDLAINTPNINIQSFWTVNACGVILYGGNIYVVGPAGTHY